MSPLLQRMRAMRGALALSIALFALGAGLGWLAWMNHEARGKVARERIALETRLRNETLAMRATEADARRFIEAYDRLARRGVVGAWDKLAAIDRFEHALAPWSGRVGRYTVALSRDGGQDAEAAVAVAVAPQPADPAAIAVVPAVGGDDAALAAQAGATRHRHARARFSIELQPSDEPDLIAALDAASRADIGIADVERCEISRRSQGESGALAASCTLSWHLFEPNPLPQAGSGGVRDSLSAVDAQSIRPLRSAHGIRLARLFMDPAERAAAARGGMAVAADPRGGAVTRATPASTGPRRVQGFLRRSGGPDVVWIDDSPSILVDPQSLSDRDASLRAGARLDPLDGRGPLRRSGDAYRTPAR